MGWLWNSQKSEPSPTPSEKHFDPPPPIQHKLSPEEAANNDLQKFLKDLGGDFDTARQQRIDSRTSGILKHTEPLPDDISPDSLYPAEMHCRSAFDYAMFCQSFGGQFVNVYRYGSFRSCSDHWKDFWLCMRTRQWSEDERKRALKDHYRNKAVKYKTGPSSEDVWKVRTEPVKDAFQDSLEELEAKIEQWKEANADVADPWANVKGYTFKGSKAA